MKKCGCPYFLLFHFYFLLLSLGRPFLTRPILRRIGRRRARRRFPDALQAAILRPKVRGVILQAPCDIAYCMRSMPKAEAFKFLSDNGLEVLLTDGAEALYGEIMSAADRLDFTSAAEKMKDRNVMLAVGRYDHVVPLGPINAFWSVRSGNAAIRVRKDYPTSHGFMGVRVTFAADIADFIRTAAQVQ